ncbi:MAG: glycosyltransferase family 39 protein [Candidatus Thermoplasmatota archaeon]|nr:glycosyltransferase family 39 protein [Candidatus Thermoplasmatota archaeon]
MSSTTDTPETITQRLKAYLRTTPEFSLLIILILAYLFIANYFAWSATFVGGMQNFSGGSDPYYNFRSITYFITTKHWMVYDSSINYPLGTYNPRNPFFHILLVYVGVLGSPFYNMLTITKFSFLEFDAVFGALLIIPVYLITREVFGKKAGMLSAILYTLMPSNLSAGILSDGRMHTPELFFAFFVIYFFIKAVKELKKGQIFSEMSFLHPKSRLYEVRKYLQKNRIGSIYALLAAASLGALMLSWQGYAYIEAIVAIYIIVQLVVNLLLKKPTGYITVLALLFFVLPFVMSYYYYSVIHEVSPWFIDGFYIAVLAVASSIVVNIIGRRPWIITVPSLIILAAAGIFAFYLFDPSTFASILAGEGYFIKTRVYQTIAEAAAPQLGQYISGFGIAQFLLGISGIILTVYLYFKTKKDYFLLFMVFALVSIYMSFVAARFNITAAPAYAAMGGAVLARFADLAKTNEIRHRTPMESLNVRKSLKGNISFASFTVVMAVVILLIIPSGFGVMNAAVPANNAGAVNQEIYNSMPSFLKPLVNYSASNDQFVGTYGFGITNQSTPLNQAFTWLATQDTNVPVQDRPAFVSWWDYGFQEIVEGQHPTVADDFQQGYQVAGQVLMAQNQSQIVSLFIARVLEGSYQNNSNALPSNVYQTLVNCLGSNGASFLAGDIKNPGNYVSTVLNNPSIYGSYISALTPANAQFAIFSGYLPAHYSISVLNDLYTKLISETGYNIKYVGIDHSLFPVSGTDPGIFYAPEYLTDGLSYTYEGEIVPYPYYQIYAVTANQTYQLNQTPTTAIVTNYEIFYNPAFYNSTIYRFTVGYPPSAVGSSQGIPGLTVNQTTAPVMPAWNMSNFELVYAGVPWNPYTDYQNHSAAWTVVPIQTAYKYQKEGYGTTILLPTLSSVQAEFDPIVAYYPGAIIHGRVTTRSGTPVAGAHVTLFDQYGIPHDVVKTNSQGYYNLTAIPGNDSIYVTSGALNPQYLIGSTLLNNTTIVITNAQADREVPQMASGGLPGYEITKNFVASSGGIRGSIDFQYQVTKNTTKKEAVNSGILTFSNTTSGQTYNVSIKSGNYSLNNVSPESYNVSLTANNKTYEDFSTVTISTNNNITQNLLVQMDTIYASAFAGNISLLKVKFTATSGRFNTSAYTNSSGIALLQVVPGNYNVYVSGPGFASVAEQIEFSTWGLNTTFLAAPVLSAEVSGNVATNSVKEISFFSNGNLSKAYNASVVDGKFSISLPVGYYTAYAKSGYNVYAHSLLVTDNTSISVVLSRGYYVNVSSTTTAFTNGTGSFEALSNGMSLQSATSLSTYYIFFLPGGTYSFAASVAHAGLNYGAFRTIQVLGNLSFTMKLAFQTNVSISTSDTYQSSSGAAVPQVTSGVVIEYAGNIPIYYSIVLATGGATVIHPKTLVGTYSFYLYSPGFLNSSSSADYNSAAVELNVTPILTTFNLNLSTIAGGALSGYVSLQGLQSYLFKISNMTASGILTPGLYSVSIFSTSAAVNSASSVIAVPIKSSYYSSTAASQLFSLSSTATSFSVYKNGIQIGSTFLAAGFYTVYSQSGLKSNITSLYLGSNTTVSPVLQTSSIVSLSNTLGYTSGTYFISSSSGIISTSNNTTILPLGTYDVSYYYNYTRNGVDISVSGSTLISTSASKSVNVPVSVAPGKTTIRGATFNNGVPVPYTTVMFYNNTGYLVGSSISNAYGNYSVQLYGGSYTVYAINNADKEAALTNLAVTPFGTPESLNISLVPSYKVFITETKGNILLLANVSISSGPILLLFNTSEGSIALPGGTYTFSGNLTVREANYTGSNMNITYSSSVTQNIAAQNTYVSVQLLRVDVYQFSSGLISPVRTVKEGSNVTNLSFYVVNTGNTFVNMTFSSGESGLTASFNRSKVMIAPGQNISISANLVLPRKMLAGIDTLQINGTYGSSVYNIQLSVNVSPSPSFIAYLNPAKNSVYLNTGSIPVILSNTGNELMTVYVALDPDNLSNHNWIGNISTGLYYSAKLSAFSSKTIYVNVTPISGESLFLTGDLTLNITTSTNISTYLNVPVKLPNNINLKPTISGTEITHFTGDPELTIIIGVVIIAASVIIGLVVASSRGRRRNR